MADYVLEGPKWGSAPFGAGGGTVNWSFADLANGHRFYDWNASITGQFRAEVEQAFSRWQSVANIRFIEVMVWTTASTGIEYLRVVAAVTPHAGSYRDGDCDRRS